MDNKLEFTSEEKKESLLLLSEIRQQIGNTLKDTDEAKIREQLQTCLSQNKIQRDVFGLNPILTALQTAQIAVNEIGLKRDGVLAILLFPCMANSTHDTIEKVAQDFGPGGRQNYPWPD